MMKRLIVIVSLIISILMYAFAPILYDRDFCIACMIVFIVVAAIIIRDDVKHIGFLNFNLFFLFSFFVCSYVYPAFLIGHKSIIGALIENDLYTFNTVNRCVAICTLAICIYGLAYTLIRKKSGIYITNQEYIEASLLYHNTRKLMAIVCVAMLIVLVNFTRTSHDVSIEVTDFPYLFQLFYIILPLFLVCSSIFFKNSAMDKIPLKTMIEGNKFILIILLLLLLLFLYIGDRAPLITISLTILFTVVLFIKKVKLMTLLCVGVVGILLMFALRVTRGGDSSLSEGGLDTFILVTQSSIMENVSPWDLLSDLVGINMELNAGMDYVDNYGYLHTGANAIVTVTSPIPFLPTILTRFIYGKLPIEVNSGTVIGDYTNSAAGNHCVIDMFMPFGVVGVVFAFFIMGCGVAKISNGLNKNLFCNVFYIYLMSSAIFVARNSVTNIYRAFVLSFIVYYLLLWFNNKMVAKHKQLAKTN